jgi:hypothetical protein
VRARYSMLMVVLLASQLAAGAAGAAGSVRAARPAAQGAPAFLVIVNPDNRVSRLDRKFVEDVFLKKRTRWDGDRTIKPVDLGPDSRVRAGFSRQILHRSVEAVKSYWQQLVFSGRGVPPPELDDDDAVVHYVLEHRGTIGYVAGDADLAGARVVEVR